MKMALDFEHLRHHLRSALVADVMDAMDLRDQCLAAGIVPLRSSDVLVGRAFTVAVVEADVPVVPPYQGLLRALDAIGLDEVFVFPTGRSSRAAVWGELVSTTCRARGAAGALTDGVVRDTERVRRLEFPVFAAGTRPLDVNGRLEITGHGLVAHIDGVRIRPGDLIVGDADGVAIVPVEVEAAVIERALEKDAREAEFRAAVADGMAPTTAFDRFGVL
jgi:4-hydroxy-4-methyl-2-oxoglutarate aldolase